MQEEFGKLWQHNLREHEIRSYLFRICYGIQKNIFMEEPSALAKL